MPPQLDVAFCDFFVPDFEGRYGEKCFIFAFVIVYSLRMGKYFTTEEAAKYLSVTPSRVRQFIIENRLKSEKYGRDHLIKEVDLIEFAKVGKKKRGRPKGQSKK